MRDDNKRKKELKVQIKNLLDTNMKRANVVKAIQRALKGMSPTIEVKLYGSEARSDARIDSDIDLLILVDKEEVLPDTRMKMRQTAE